MFFLQQNMGEGREVSSRGNFSVKMEERGWKGESTWDFFLPLRTTEYSFGFRAMNSLS